jgi:hypothetical protein
MIVSHVRGAACHSMAGASRREGDSAKAANDHLSGGHIAAHSASVGVVKIVSPDHKVPLMMT